MSMIEDVLSQLRNDVDAALKALKSDLGRLRTGRASISILDGIRVNYYGVSTLLSQCANLSVSDARMINVKPWDRGLIGEIEKAILQSDIGITPQNDGDMIRLPIPQLTEERRKDLVKQAKGRGEDGKISLRNYRREANDMLKELEKDKEISQDDLKRALEKVQAEIDRGSAGIDQILETKEKEILEV